MRIEHVALYVRDLEAACRFFETYLGGTAGAPYRNETTGFRSYFLSFDAGARLEIMTRPELAEGGGRPAAGTPTSRSRWAASRPSTSSPSGCAPTGTRS